MTWMFDTDPSHVVGPSTHLTLGVLSSATLHDTPAWSHLTTSCAIQSFLGLLCSAERYVPGGTQVNSQKAGVFVIAVRVQYSNNMKHD